MNKSGESTFKSRKTRYGAFSTLTAVFVIAILIVINLVMEKVNLNWDLTPDRFYSVSDKTKEVLSENDKDVTIYTLFKTGEEVAMYSQMLEEYEALPHITVENKDPYLNVAFIEKYKEEGKDIPVNSVIVQGPSKSKVIYASELFSTTFDYYTLSETVSTIDFEPRITSAIKYVTSENTYNIYKITGHGESDLSENYKKQISSSNFDLKELNLYSTGAIPEDASILLVTTPAMDWALEEAELVKTYLEYGGKAIFFVDFTNTALPALKSVVNSYGVDLEDNIVIEGDTAHMIPMNGSYNPLYIAPKLLQHGINNSVMDSGYSVLMPETRPLKMLDVKRDTINIETLMVSSDSSYIKDLSGNISTLNYETGDTKGPFDLGYAITENYSASLTKETTKIIVLGSTSLINDSYNNGANSLLVMNMFNWLQDEKEDIYIPGKPVLNSALNFTSYNEILKIFIVSFVVLPVIIIVSGITVYIRRRNK